MHLPQSDERAYVLGHSDGELARLEHQAEIFRPQTEDILQRAGIREGMRVLDIGCGVGDVSMAAAAMVGSTGSVTGIDKAGSALFLARARAQKAGFDHVAFAEADANTYQADEPFDAIVGRFILMHLPDAEATLRHLVSLLRPGGAVAFIEMDIATAGAQPELPLLSKCVRWIMETYDHTGVESNMGSRLYATCRAAGLQTHLTGSVRIESGPNSITYDFVAETLRTLIPAMEEAGIATEDEVGVDILADRLRHQSVAGDHCIFFPRVVGAWATLEAS